MRHLENTTPRCRVHDRGARTGVRYDEERMSAVAAVGATLAARARLALQLAEHWLVWTTLGLSGRLHGTEPLKKVFLEQRGSPAEQFAQQRMLAFVGRSTWLHIHLQIRQIAAASICSRPTRSCVALRKSHFDSRKGGSTGSASRHGAGGAARDAA